MRRRARVRDEGAAVDDDDCFFGAALGAAGSAVVAIVLWLIGSALLSWYLSNFANYTATYGSLGAAIGLMTWLWLSAIIVLIGAELNSEIEFRAGLGPSPNRSTA